MKLDSELRTLLYLQKVLRSDYSSKKALIILKILMFSLILACLATFIFTTENRISSTVGMPIVGICGLFIGYISYYIHSIEIWPHYSPHIDKNSVEKRLNEIKT